MSPPSVKLGYKHGISLELPFTPRPNKTSYICVLTRPASSTTWEKWEGVRDILSPKRSMQEWGTQPSPASLGCTVQLEVLFSQHRSLSG